MSKENNNLDKRENSSNEKNSIFQNLKRGKYKNRFLLFKIIGIAAIIIIVLYLIYYKTGYDKANFILSNDEILSIDNYKEITQFKAKKGIHFYINRNRNVINAGVAVIEIDFFQGNSYNYYKKITYEINKDFQKLNSYIPEEYFNHPGKYRIKAYLDGNLIASRDIIIEE